MVANLSGFLAVPPTIISRMPNEVKVHEGNVLYLRCGAEGIPSPIIVWRKNGSVPDNQTFVNGHIVRENVTKADAGVYVCLAYNSVGRDSYRIKVSVLPIQGKRF